MKKIRVLEDGRIELPLDVKPGEVIYDETTEREVVVDEVITPEEAKKLRGLKGLDGAPLLRITVEPKNKT